MHTIQAEAVVQTNGAAMYSKQGWAKSPASTPCVLETNPKVKWEPLASMALFSFLIKSLMKQHDLSWSFKKSGIA